MLPFVRTAAAAAKKISPYITWRGLFLLLFLLYLVKGPVLGEADIVASVLAYSMFVVLLGAALITLIQGQLLRRGLGVAAVRSFSSLSSVARLESGEKTAFVLRLSPCSIPPLFELKLRIWFKNEPLMMPLHTIKGSMLGERLITQEVTFPHRGSWTIGGARLTFGDQLGLTALRWTLDEETIGYGFTVYPPRISESRLPVLSSCYRAGEELVDVHERRGEPFDLKRYHPSDGVKKIVWKIFAKSGVLMARHPEPAMSPEGQVAVFCLAGPGEDRTASVALAYLRRLVELELQIFFVCEGMNGEEPARTAEEAEEALVSCVWQTSAEAGAAASAFERFLGSVQASLSNSRLERVLIFAGIERLYEPAALELFARLGEIAERRQASPVYLLTGATPAPLPAPAPVGLPPLAARWFLDAPAERPARDERVVPDFMSLSLRKRWQVIAEEAL